MPDRRFGCPEPVIPQEGAGHDDRLPHDRDDRRPVRLSRGDRAFVEFP